MAKYKLDELCEFITDGTHQTPEYCEEGGVIFLSSKDVTERKINWNDVKHIPESLHQKLYKRLSPKLNDILLAKNGTTGVAAIVDKDEVFDVYVSLAVLRPLKIVYPKYLLYAINSPVAKRQFNAGLKGIGVPNLHLSVIRETVVNVAPRDEQEKICKILDKVASVIDSRKEELYALDNLIKARFVELFGDPKLNDKGWNAGIISDYYEVKGGKRIPKGMGYADGVTAHPYLRATDMKNETILDDDIHYIDEEVYEHIKRYTVKNGDIYLTNVGVNLGMAGVIPEKYDGANLTENAVKLVPKTEKVIDGVFLAHYINSPGIQDYINERKMSVGVPKLAIFRIETMPLLLPPMDIQMQFIEFRKQVDKSKVVVQKALDETQMLFDSLMQEYFG